MSLHKIMHADSSDEDDEQLAHALQKMMRETKQKKQQSGQVRIAIEHQKKFRPDYPECPCPHFPSCPYRQEAERLTMANTELAQQMNENAQRIIAIENDNSRIKDVMEAMKRDNAECIANILRQIDEINKKVQ